MRVLATTSSPERLGLLRDRGITPLQANLDKPSSLVRLASLASRVLVLAPPRSQGVVDSRTQHLIQALRLHSKTCHVVYASTSGVYGDCAGAWVKETRALNAQTPRAQRRLDAEQQWRRFGNTSGASVSILRVPGIYAADRVGGDLLDKVRQGLPVLVADDDVYTNHIHANDLARAAITAVWRGKPQRTYNICEDCTDKAGDYYDRLADRAGLPRPPRITRQRAQETLSPMRLSFLSESRRLCNDRMKKELRIQPLHQVI